MTDEDGLEGLKKLQREIREYFDANEEHFHALHKRMMDAAESGSEPPTNYDIFLHATRLLDSLATQTGESRFPWPLMIGLFAYRTGLTMFPAPELAKPETTH